MTVIIEQTQDGQGWRLVFEMPIDLRFTFAGGDTLITVQNNDTLQTYQFTFAQAPTAVSLDPDEWILRYAELGIDENQEHMIPTAQTILRCTPNPLSGRAVIEYALPVAREVSIDLYNAVGQRVGTLVHGRYDAGVRQLAFDASSLPGGIYFLRLNERLVRKIIKVTQ